MRRPILAALVALAPLAARAEGNADNGQRLFNQCRVCHTAEQGGRNGVGPNLFQVVGRPAGTVQGFNYSPNLREEAAKGLTWDEATLRRYLANPKDLLPQGRMSFPGFRDNQQNAEDVIAYLRRVGGN